MGAHVDQTDPIAEALAREATASQFFLGDPQAWKGPKVAYAGGAAQLKADAEAAGISRKVLYQLFQRELHQTPVDFILRRRLGLARRLLAESGEKEYLIARRCGMPMRR